MTQEDSGVRLMTFTGEMGEEMYRESVVLPVKWPVDRDKERERLNGQHALVNNGGTLTDAEEEETRPKEVFTTLGVLDPALTDKDKRQTAKELAGDYERESWPGKWDFLMACLGYAVGFGNVWRFPSLAYKNGGGAFLIPFFLCSFLAGIPVFFLEVAMGQFMSEGTITVWKLIPMFKGFGYGTVVIVTLLNIYYIIILAWVFFYLFATIFSFGSVLPWSTCGNWWNSPNCVTGRNETVDNVTEWTNSTMTPALATLTTPAWLDNSTVGAAKIDAAAEFWRNRVLQLSTGIDDVGTVVWELALCLLLSWILCYFIIWKGTQSSSKVVYITATAPYIMLFILFIRGVTLPGAINGIIYYIYPDFSRLADGKVWMDAGTQIFFSYAICTSTIVAMGSYNRFHHNCYRDSLILCSVNSLTSFFAGFVIFSVLGFMAHEQNVDVKDLALDGPGLTFIVYPKAIAQMPWAPVWSVLFFLMLITLGIDSEFVGVEGFVTAISDIFPQLRRKSIRESFIALVCFVYFLIGLIMVTKGGMFVFQLFDNYAASGPTLLWFCFFECVAIGYAYGADRFYDDIEQMIGFRISPWCKFCWKYVTPVVCAGIFIFSLVTWSPMEYSDINYVFPAWAEGLGWMMALASMICIPGYIAVKSFSIDKFKALMVPQFNDRHMRRRARRRSSIRR
ncbi:sodium- and chloride-dependent taurine transporter-like [Paramacrobiotus metropolitanus]|uniref:sodium- and chloride-dependent taurine transporter-like n=1 Tax=Paramacrobiotus metropolitanus TaxID=2943436 RepID=UPI002446127A|nr:sodium- and chloride-dependent taurine transporter-like [Paramacrobiotus metropolitanus]